MEALKVLIVGAGPTGSLIACFLKQSFKERVAVEVWEKSRGIGGRMSTSRIASGDSNLTLDLGAQYISTTKEYQMKHKSIYDELLNNNILTPLSGVIEGDRYGNNGALNYVTPKGVSSIPKYFFGKSKDTSVRSSTLLHSININGETFNASGTYSSSNNPEKVQTKADVIILTLPVPQILNLKGDISSMAEKYRPQLEKVKYSSRYALGLFFENISDLPGINWSAKYITNDECIRYISIDTKKRNADSKNGVSMVVHCSVPFTIKNLESSFSQVQPMVEEHLYKLLPELPKATSSKFLRWRYSQVTEPYEKQPGCLLLNTSPLMILAGDAFTHSNFDGCVSSAESVLKLVEERFPVHQL